MLPVPANLSNGEQVWIVVVRDVGLRGWWHITVSVDKARMNRLKIQQGVMPVWSYSGIVTNLSANIESKCESNSHH